MLKNGKKRSAGLTQYQEGITGTGDPVRGKIREVLNKAEGSRETSE
jgi:hypothetical protein